MKLVLNDCFGGFELSIAAYKVMGVAYTIDARNTTLLYASENFNNSNKRNDPRLIEAVEKLGVDANGKYAKLKIIEIPDGSYFHIQEYDGMENIIYSKSPIYYA
jgi:hypothetical protein